MKTAQTLAANLLGGKACQPGSKFVHHTMLRLAIWYGALLACGAANRAWSAAVAFYWQRWTYVQQKLSAAMLFLYTWGFRIQDVKPRNLIGSVNNDAGRTVLRYYRAAHILCVRVASCLAMAALHGSSTRRATQ
jgi:hypothetical protein